MAIRSSWATGEVLTSDDLTDTVADKVSRQGDTLSGQLDSAQLTPMHQFAADGSVLANLPARVHPAEQLLKQAVWWVDAAHSSASGQSVKNLGWGGSALDAQVGSTGSADSNDPKYLAWEGENYVYCPGVAGNYLSVPDEAALDITGDIDIRVKVALDDWTPASGYVPFATKSGASGNRGWMFDVGTSGDLRFVWWPDGTSSASATSTVTNGIADGAVKWVRVTVDVDNGASGRDVKFYLSDDGVSWTQLGSTVTQAGTTSLFNNSAALEVGSNSASGVYASAKFYRAQVLNGIDGTPVLDIDCSQISSGADTSFTALTGQTVSINRSTSGRKTVGVVHPRWLFGTDDYMQVADNALLDFGASDSFTVLAVVRQWGSATNNGPLVNKRDAAGFGWTIGEGGTNLLGASIGDSTPTIVADRQAFTSGGLLVLSGVVDRVAQTLTGRTGTTAGTLPSTAAVGSLANTYPVRIGRLSDGGTSYADMEFTAAAIWRRALTAGELATLTSYFQGREGA